MKTVEQHMPKVIVHLTVNISAKRLGRNMQDNTSEAKMTVLDHIKPCPHIEPMLVL